MILLILAILTVLFGIGFAITGALLSALFWLCVKLPVGLVLIFVGVALCCTILLIPVGKALVSMGVKLIV